MKVKIIHELNEEDSDKAKRLMCTDDAFSLLWDIVNTDIRSYFKYNHNPSKEEAEKVLDKIRDNIHESGLLDLYI